MIGEYPDELTGLSRLADVPLGNFLKAASVGAKTVNAGLFNVPTRSAALTTATSVLNEPAATAVSTTSAAFDPDVDTIWVSAPAANSFAIFIRLDHLEIVFETPDLVVVGRRITLVAS